MSTRDIFLAVMVPCLWGFGFVISKQGMDHFPPILLNGLRWSLTGVCLVWWFRFPKKLFKNLFIVSWVGCTIQYSLTFSGLNLIDASSAVLLVQTEVPFGILIAFLILKEKPSMVNLLATFVAFIGVFVLAGAPNLENKLLGVFLVLSGAMTWSFGQILAKKISENVSGIAMTAWLGVFAGPQLIFLSFIIEGNTYTYIISANKEAWLIVLYLGFVMNALGYSIWYFLLGKHPVHKIIPVLLLLPVVGVICAVLILGENLENQVFIGGFIIMLGVGMILFSDRKKNKV